MAVIHCNFTDCTANGWKSVQRSSKSPLHEFHKRKPMPPLLHGAYLGIVIIPQTYWLIQFLTCAYSKCQVWYCINQLRPFTETSWSGTGLHIKAYTRTWTMGTRKEFKWWLNYTLSITASVSYILVNLQLLFNHVHKIFQFQFCQIQQNTSWLQWVLNQALWSCIWFYILWFYRCNFIDSIRQLVIMKCSANSSWDLCMEVKDASE